MPAERALPPPPGDRLFAFTDYSCRKVYNYRPDTVEIIQKNMDVRRFIDLHADLLNHRPGAARKPALQWLQYKSAKRAIPGIPLDAPLLDKLEPHEDAFVHAKGKPATRQYRMRYFDGNAFLMDPRSPVWRQHFTTYTLTLAEQAKAQGLFLDEVGTYLYCGHWYYYPVRREEHDLTSSDTIELNETIHPETSVDRILVQAVPGGAQRIRSFSGSQIRLEAPHSGRVLVDYPALAKADDELTFDTGHAQVWKAATEEFVREVTQAAHERGLFVIYNGNVPYTNQPERILPLYDKLPTCADGMMNEMFIYNGSRVPGVVDEAAWLRCVEDLKRWGATKRYWCISTLHERYREEPEYRKAALFCYCSFLLGKGDWSYFMFGMTMTFDWFWFYEYELGRPLGDYGRMSDTFPVYYRDFEKALVLVNPGKDAAYVKLNQQYISMEEGQPVSSFLLPGTSGVILRKIQ